MIGTTLWFDFSRDEKFETSFEGLIKEIHVKASRQSEQASEHFSHDSLTQENKLFVSGHTSVVRLPKVLLTVLLSFRRMFSRHRCAANRGFNDVDASDAATAEPGRATTEPVGGVGLEPRPRPAVAARQRSQRRLAEVRATSDRSVLAAEQFPLRCGDARKETTLPKRPVPLDTPLPAASQPRLLFMPFQLDQPAI